jgi:hypothetical protein
VDLCAMAEPCINTQNKRVTKSFKATTYTAFSKGSLILSHNNNISNTNYQPGGSLLLSNESWSTKKLQEIQDPRKWGRFCGAIYRLNSSKYMVIYSGYRCVQKSGESYGVKTTVIHQREGIKKLGLNSTVRQLYLEDMERSIKEVKRKYGEDILLIIMMDANESLLDNSTLLQFKENNLLEDSIEYLHSPCNIATHTRSSSGRCIDYILVSKNLCPSLRFGGYLPFYAAISSDHRGIFIDIDISSAMDKYEYIMPKQKEQLVHMRKTTL